MALSHFSLIHIFGGVTWHHLPLCFPDFESEMKIHLPLSWPLVGVGVTWIPRLEDYLTGPCYINWPVGMGAAGLTDYIQSTREKHRNQLEAKMKVLKVEELVCKTYYFYLIKMVVLIFIWKMEMPISFRYNAQVFLNTSLLEMVGLCDEINTMETMELVLVNSLNVLFIIFLFGLLLKYGFTCNIKRFLRKMFVAKRNVCKLTIQGQGSLKVLQ